MDDREFLIHLKGRIMNAIEPDCRIAMQFGRNQGLKEVYQYICKHLNKPTPTEQE